MLFGIVITSLVGLFFSGLAIWLPKIILKLDAADWPAAQGLITSNRVFETGRSRSGPKCRAEIMYSYTVDGKLFRSTEVSPFAQLGEGKAAAEELSAKYPIGGTVSVRYNPASPKQSMLEPGLDWSLAAYLLFAIPVVVLIGAGFASWLVLLRRRWGGTSPGGLAVLIQPLPRLRTLRLPPSCCAALYGGGLGLITMVGLGLCVQNEISPVATFGGLFVMASVSIGVWVHYHTSNRRGCYDIVVDPTRRLLVRPEGHGEPRTITLTGGEALRLSSEMRPCWKTEVRFHTVSIVQSAQPGEADAPRQLLYDNFSALDTAEVAGWLAQQTGLPIYQEPEKPRSWAKLFNTGAH